VIDYTTYLPVGNANVTLTLTREMAFDRYPTYHYTVADAHGNYSFSVPIEDENQYKIIPSKTGFVFVDTNASWFQSIDGTSTYFDTVLIDAASILQVNFHDVNAASFNDTLDLLIGFNSDSSSINYYWNNPYLSNHRFQSIISYNNTVHFSDSASYKQNCYAKIIYEVHKYSHQPESDTIVQLIPFGTRIVDLFY
jgi:hypothetical protein